MIVLDTHTLIWWVNGDQRLSGPADEAISTNLKSDAVFVSSISAWEVAMLVAKNRLDLDREVLAWIDVAASVEGLHFIPVDNMVAVYSQALPGEFHPDPADRIIVALARHMDAPLVTADEKIRSYRYVRTIW